MANIGYGVVRTLARQMFNHLQKLSLAFYDRNEVGRIYVPHSERCRFIWKTCLATACCWIRRFDLPSLAS